jgi:hypothetical protein
MTGFGICEMLSAAYEVRTLGGLMAMDSSRSSWRILVEAMTSFE